MTGHHFISYSPDDARDIAAKLSTDLERSQGGLRTWLDQRDLVASRDWAEETDEAVRTCRSFIFVLSEDSARKTCRCTQEWRRALSYAKPITIVQITESVPCPFRLEGRKCIDFIANPAAGLSELTERLLRLDTPDGQMEILLEQMTDAKRDLEYAPPGQKPRIMAELDTLEQKTKSLQDAMEHAESVSDRIARGIERERQPVPRRDLEARFRFVNPPPMIAPRYFQDRFLETKLLGQFLRDPASCLLTISGLGGVGKTAFVCRALKNLEGGVLPDDGGELAVKGIVYMNAAGSREITFPNLFADLQLVLEPEERRELQRLSDNPQATVAMKVRALLKHFGGIPVVILLDNFEDVVSSDSRRIRDTELANCLQLMIESRSHSLKIIVTTRINPLDFAETPPARHLAMSLDEGLDSPFAERILREMDSDGHVGLRGASDATLAKIKEYTRGFPRALEAFYSILEQDRDTSIDDILSWKPSDRIVHVLVGEAFSRLSDIDQRVMQGLAVYGYPSSVTAIDYLLAPWFPFIDSAVSLKRLVHMHMVRKEGPAYYLHPVDREYALSRLEPTSVPTEASHIDVLSKDSLLARAADYYEELKRPQLEWKSLDDLEPHVREFSLRLEARQDQQASEILSGILNFLEKRGAFEQLSTMARALLKYTSDHDSRRIALKGIAKANWRAGKLRDALSAQEELIQLLEQRGDRNLIFQEKTNKLIYGLDQGVTEDLLQGLRDAAQLLEDDYPWDTTNLQAVLANVATCEQDLGYLDEALDHQERALGLVRMSDIDRFEAQTHNLGSGYEELGKIGKATQLYEKALALSDKSENPLWKANHLSALAGCFAEDGSLVRAVNYNAKALEIREAIGDLSGIARNIRRGSVFSMANGDLPGARQAAQRANDLAQDLGTPLSSFQATWAEILLSSEELPEAQRLILKALEWPYGARWHRENVLGLILLRRRIRSDATAAFTRAVAAADTWLGRCDSNPAAWSGKGLALAGLVACGEGSSLPGSIEAYRRARELHGGLGAIAARLRLFGELSKAAAKHPDLPAIQLAISGEDSQLNPEASNDMGGLIFVSYAREDKTWLDRLMKVMAPLTRKKVLDVWHDGNIKPGAKWRDEISEAMNHARVGVLLVSQEFLASTYIVEKELPYLLNAADEKQVRIVWVLVEQCLYEETPIFDLQAAHDIKKPLISLNEHELGDCLVEIARAIKSALDE